MKGGQTRAVLVEGINRLSRSQADIGQLFANSCRAAIKVRIRIASFDGVPEANLVASSGMFLGGSAWRDRGPWVCRSSFLVRQAAVSPSQLTHGSGSERSGGQGRRGVNGTLKLTHFACCRHLQSDPPAAVSFVFAGRAMMPARRCTVRSRPSGWRPGYVA